MYKQLIISTCKREGLNLHEAAYVLATADWETNHTFEPVREAYWKKNAEQWRKKNLRYYPWYGRGFVQLTWEKNYLKAGKAIGVDLIKNPDLAMDPNNAAAILVIGMRDGWFTGKDLDDKIDGIEESDKEDFLEYYYSRIIVNGMDKANDIAVLAEKYEKELREANYSPSTPSNSPADGNVDTDSRGDSQNWFALLLRLLRAIIKLFAKGS